MFSETPSELEFFLILKKAIYFYDKPFERDAKNEGPPERIMQVHYMSKHVHEPLQKALDRVFQLVTCYAEEK